MITTTTLKNNFKSVNYTLSLLDYFTREEQIRGEAYCSVNLQLSRKGILAQLITKAYHSSNLISNTLTTNYSKTYNSPAGIVMINKLLASNYYSVVTRHTVEELVNANSLMLCYKDAKKEANLPPICVVLVKDYYPINNYDATNPQGQVQVLHYELPLQTNSSASNTNYKQLSLDLTY